MFTQKYTDADLAINGARPARSVPDSSVYPGGMLIDDPEEQAVVEVIRSKRLFRYYGPNPGPSQADLLEKEFASYAGAQYALAVSSCTAALVCSLQGIGVGPGDEVISPGALVLSFILS